MVEVIMDSLAAAEFRGDSEKKNIIQKTCACRGIRYCALCKTFRGPQSSDEVSQSFSVEIQEIYDYCFECQKAYLSTSDWPSMNDHHSHGSASDDISFSLGEMCLWTDFVTEAEEDELISQIDGRKWVDSQSGRRKQDYGPKVNFKRQKVNLEPFTGLPDFSQSLLAKMNDKKQLTDFRCAELCNLEYLPQRESHIDAHVDDEWLWGERLVTLNLGSSTVLTLCPRAADFSASFLLVRVPMPRRSLFVMAGDSRHAWKHAIRAADIRSRRLAMTFRELTTEFTSGSQKDLGEAIFSVAYRFTGDVVHTST